MSRVLRHPIAWILGYREVPFGSRTIFRHELRHIMCWAIVWGSLNAPFCGYVALRGMEASDVLVAIITAAMAFANLLAVWWAAVARRTSRRRLMLLTLGLTSAVLLSFALTPQFDAVTGAQVPRWFRLLSSPTVPVTALVFTLQVVLAWMVLQGTNMVRTSIWRINYPQLSRGRVLARFAVWQMLIGGMWVALIGAYFDGALSRPDWLGGALDLSWLPGAGQPRAYAVFFPLAGVAGLASLWLFRHIHIRSRDVPPNGADLESEDGPLEPSYALPAWLVARLQVLRSGIRVALLILRNDARFREYMGWVFLSGSAVLMINVPFLLILKGTFEINYTQAALLLTFLPQVAVVAVTPMWGRLFDRWPLYYFRAVQISMWGLSRAALAFGVWQASMPAVVISVLISGAALGGGRFAWQLGHMRFSSHANDTAYLGVHQTLTGIRGLTLPFIGVLLYRYVLDWHIIWLSAVMLCVASTGYYRMYRRDVVSCDAG